MKYRTTPFNFDSLQLRYVDLIKLLLGKTLTASSLKISMKEINLVTGEPELNVQPVKGSDDAV